MSAEKLSRELGSKIRVDILRLLAKKELSVQETKVRITKTEK